MAHRRWICRASGGRDPGNWDRVGDTGYESSQVATRSGPRPPRQWQQRRTISPSTPAGHTCDCRIRRGFRVRCSVLGCPGAGGGCEGRGAFPSLRCIRLPAKSSEEKEKPDGPWAMDVQATNGLSRRSSPIGSPERMQVTGREPSCYCGMAWPVRPVC